VKIAPVPGDVILSVGLVILHRSSMAHMSCALSSIECDTYSWNEIDKSVKDKSVKDKSVKDKSVKDKSVKDKSVKIRKREGGRRRRRRRKTQIWKRDGDREMRGVVEETDEKDIVEAGEALKLMVIKWNKVKCGKATAGSKCMGRWPCRRLGHHRFWHHRV